jgi:hypothetical protein
MSSLTNVLIAVAMLCPLVLATVYVVLDFNSGLLNRSEIAGTLSSVFGALYSSSTIPGNHKSFAGN